MVKGAIATDFILSAEIMVISLNEVRDEAFLSRLLILVVVAIGITALVYGAIYAPAGSLRRGPPTAGVVGFVNILDATPGRVQETDSQFRARHMVAQRGLGGASPDAIRAIALTPVALNGGGATFASGADIF